MLTDRIMQNIKIQLDVEVSPPATILQISKVIKVIRIDCTS